MEKEIRNQIINNIIQSPEIKDYWKTIEYDLTDVQWLNIIIHNYVNLADLENLLCLLKENTKSKRLKKLIDKLIKIQMNALDDIHTNNGNYIYMIHGYWRDYKNSINIEDIGCVKHLYDAEMMIIDHLIHTYDLIHIEKIKLIRPNQKHYSLISNIVGKIEYNKKANVILCNTDKYNIYDIIAHTNYDVNIFVPHAFKYRDKIIDLNSNRTGTIISSTNNKNWYQDFEYEETCFNIKFDNGDPFEYINIFNLSKRSNENVL